MNAAVAQAARRQIPAAGLRRRERLYHARNPPARGSANGRLGVLTNPGEALICACRGPQGATPVACDRGGVAEWLKAADCKSAGGCLRRFESYPLHQRYSIVRNRGGFGTGVAYPYQPDGRSELQAGVAQW